MLACTFWKSDPVKYRGCFTLKLHGIPRVKQHLTRNHTPIFCQRCLAIFQDHDSLEKHVGAQETLPCTLKRLAQLDGISPRQQQELSRKLDSSLTEPERWFKIWDIVLPRRARPSSPYMDDQLSEDCAAFHNHCLSRGPEFLAREIETSGIMTLASLDEETRRDVLQETLAQGLDLFLQSWVPPRMARSAASSSRSLTGSPRNLDVLEASDATTATDSGVWTRSQDPGSSSSGSPRQHPSERASRSQVCSLEGRDLSGIVDISTDVIGNTGDQSQATTRRTMPTLSACDYGSADVPQDGVSVDPSQSHGYSTDNIDWPAFQSELDEWFKRSE